MFNLKVSVARLKEAQQRTCSNILYTLVSLLLHMFVTLLPGVTRSNAPARIFAAVMFTACCAREFSVGGVAGRVVGEGSGELLARISHICSAVPMSAITERSAVVAAPGFVFGTAALFLGLHPALRPFFFLLAPPCAAPEAFLFFNSEATRPLPFSLLPLAVPTLFFLFFFLVPPAVPADAASADFISFLAAASLAALARL